MKKIHFIITILLQIGIVSVTPTPMGTLINNDSYLNISTYDGEQSVSSSMYDL